MSNTPNSFTETYVVVLVGEIPRSLIQLTLEPEGSRSNPRPVPATEEQRIAEKIMEHNPFGLMGVDMMRMNSPKTILVLNPDQYKKIGSPGVGYRIELGVNPLGS